MERYIDERVMKRFKDTLSEMEKSSATICKYVRDVETFRGWIGRNKQITKHAVLQFKQVLREKYRLSSANSMISALNMFFKVVDWTECRILTFKTQRATFRSEKKELTVAEFHRLLDAAENKGDTQIRLIMERISDTDIIPDEFVKMYEVFTKTLRLK